jgi:hypothetical protein
MKPTSLAIMLLPWTSVLAQNAIPTDFPPEASQLSAQDLSQRVSGKVLDGFPADGNDWRLEYNSNGYMFVDTKNGFRDSGKWHTEDGKLCSNLAKLKPGCNEVRAVGEVLYLKRDSGEVLKIVARQ